MGLQQLVPRRGLLRWGLGLVAAAAAMAPQRASAKMLTSRLMACGQVSALNFASPATTTIAVQSTFYTANVTGATVALLSGSEQFDNPSGHQLRYIGAETRLFHCGCTVSYATAAGQNQLVGLRLAKSGTSIATSEIRDVCATNDVDSTAIHEVIELATNDYLEIFVTNHSGTNGVKVNGLNIFAVSAM